MTTNPDTDAADEPASNRRGAASFCVPRAALDALIEARADVVTIGAYLTLACGTELSGEYSTWGRKSIRERLRVDLKRAEKALAALGTITAQSATGETEPLVLTRQALLETGRVLPDGPTERGKVLHALPTFGEALKDRVWFGAGLVQGFEGFVRPLKTLKDCGSIAARLLLLFYRHNDMERFAGVPPTSNLVWRAYTTRRDEVRGSFRLIHAERGRDVAGHLCFAGASGENPFDWQQHGASCWAALGALESHGFIYAVVMAFNRNSEPRQFYSGREYGAVPEDADPLYELDCLTAHGYKPKGEEGIAGPLARTCGELNCPVTDYNGTFFGKYPAIAPKGSPLMIAGIFRLRFRVSNPLNVGVRGAWERIREGNQEGMRWVKHWRQELKLPPLQPRPPQPAGGIAPARSIPLPQHSGRRPVPDPAASTTLRNGPGPNPGLTRVNPGPGPGLVTANPGLSQQPRAKPPVF